MNNRLITNSILIIIIIQCLGCGSGQKRGDGGDQEQQSSQIDSLPEHLLYIYTSAGAQQAPSTSRDQLFAGQRRWEPNRKLRVCMFSGNDTVATLIKEVASEWNKNSSVTLDFGTARSGNNCLSPQSGFYQIRIGFSERGYWSVIGKDSESMLDPLAPSMNLEHFNRYYSGARYAPDVVTAQAMQYHKATIRHEFGHALGFLHEQQNPALKCQEAIKWEGAGNVYEYFAGPPNKWDKEKVDRNLGFIGLSDRDFIAGEADSKSIMMYSLPREIFKAGASTTCIVPINYDISERDHKLIATLYPKDQNPPPQEDLDLGTANIKPLPKQISENNRADILARVLVDLESNDPFTRRDARAHLAELLRNGSSHEEVDKLVSSMNGASYRYQLGVATALANSLGKAPLNEGARQILAAQARAALNTTLRRNIRQAIGIR